MDAPPQALTGSRITGPKEYSLKGDIALSLAFHSGDFKGAQVLLDLIAILEPMNHVDVVLSIMGGVESLPDSEWFEFHKKAQGIFKSVVLNKVRVKRSQVTDGPSRDWRPNNIMFRGVVDYFLHFGRQHGAFYYLEPDCAILAHDWFTQLSSEYKSAHKPFMGVIRQATHRATGTPLPNHMNGSGFYPNPVTSFSEALYVASQNDHPEAAPFDVAGGSSVVPQCKATKLICVDFNPTSVINPEAVVWHGDKQNQMKYTMIEKFSGVSQDRPHFQETLTSDLEKMPERIANGLNADVTAPTTPYEAYLAVLKQHGMDRPAWMRALKAYKGNKSLDSQ